VRGVGESVHCVVVCVLELGGVIGCEELGEWFGEVCPVHLVVDDPEPNEDGLVELPADVRGGAEVEPVSIGAEQDVTLRLQRPALGFVELDATANHSDGRGFVVADRCLRPLIAHPSDTEAGTG